VLSGFSAKYLKLNEYLDLFEHPLMAAKFPLAYIVATYEDLVGEWTQVFFFVATMLLSGRISLSKSRFRLFFAVLALACFYVAGEEISWGQRIFDIQTPEFLKKHNLQNETNLHNLFTGPINTWTKRILEYGIAAGLVLYGLLYPLLIRARWGLALWFEGKGLPFPPLYLWPFFVLSAVLELGFLSFNEAEIAEILIPMALAIMALNYLMAQRRQLDLEFEPTWGQTVSGQLARQTVVMVVCVIVLAFGTTASCYASPRLGQRIDNRYMNGIEKFAGRYKRYEKWDLAAMLYQRVHQEEPRRTSVLRNLFRCYKELDQQEYALTFLNKAEDFDLDYLQKKPNSISGNLSLARTYKLMNFPGKAQDRLKTGLKNARARVKKKPDSASSAYWLGKALEKTGNYSEAVQEYQRAVKLRPGYLKYQKAALRLRRTLGGGEYDADEN
jgi:tetratricopeptide (TPR) repeat protein